MKNISQTLRDRAKEDLRSGKPIDPALYEADLKVLVEELSIYQIELEYQNQELIQSQEQLQQSNDRYQDLFDNAPIGYLIVDLNGIVKDLNQTACQLFEGNKNDYLNSKITRIIHADYQDIYYIYFRTLINQKHNQTCDIKIQKSNKTYFFARIQGIRQSEGSSTEPEFRLAVIDISIQKEMEQNLLKAKERAEENNRLKTAFLQNISHEIRSPMNAIMGFSSLLPDNFDDKDKLFQFSIIIEQRCSDLLDIINDLLDISKIESGQTTIANEDCNIDTLCSELKSFFNDYRNRINKQHIELLFTSFLDNSITIIKTDKVKLKQILINLISNAFKFTEQGKIECGCKIDGDKLQLYVKDNGIGIPKDKLDFVFERFTQITNTTVQNIGGTGLGLPIVKGLVGLLGGKIWVESECNQGTTFFFTIDYVPVKESEKPVFNQTVNVVNTLKTKTILIAEDDFYNSMYLKEILQNHFTTILAVGNGNDAILYSLNNSVDLILMDVRLPDISGYEATKEILKQKPGLKIIAQTAYASNDELLKALSYGCVDYISKPTKQDQLLNLINRYLK